MTPDELRLECLKLVQQTANAAGILLTPSDVISRARAYADFVMDKSGHAGITQANGANLELPLGEGFLRPAAPPASGAFLGAAHTERAAPPHDPNTGSPRSR
jgi:hypothetical protein